MYDGTHKGVTDDGWAIVMGFSFVCLLVGLTFSTWDGHAEVGESH